MAISMVVFDFDDTLVETLEDRVATLCSAARHVLGSDITREETLAALLSGSNLESQVATLEGTLAQQAQRAPARERHQRVVGAAAVVESGVGLGEELLVAADTAAHAGSVHWESLISPLA